MVGRGLAAPVATPESTRLRRPFPAPRGAVASARAAHIGVQPPPCALMIRVARAGQPRLADG
jgi:hypothetical protein